MSKRQQPKTRSRMVWVDSQCGSHMNLKSIIYERNMYNYKYAPKRGNKEIQYN